MEGNYKRITNSLVLLLALATCFHDNLFAKPTENIFTQPSSVVELNANVIVTRCDDDTPSDLSTQVKSLPDGSLVLTFWADHGVMDKVPPATVKAWYEERELRVLYDIVPVDRDPAPKRQVSWACLTFTRIEVKMAKLSGKVDRIRIFLTRSRTVETTQIEHFDKAWVDKTLPSQR